MLDDLLRPGNLDNVPHTLIAGLPLVALCVGFWLAHNRGEREKTKHWRQIAEGWNLEAEPTRLTSPRRPLVSIDWVAASGSEDGQQVSHAGVELQLRFRDSAPSEKRGGAHLHRKQTGSIWERPIGRSPMPALTHQTALGEGRDAEFSLFTQDGEVPELLGWAFQRHVLELPELRRVDLVPSAYFGERPGELIMTAQLAVSHEARRLLPIVRAFDRAFNLDLPSPGPELTPVRRGDPSLKYMGGMALGFLVGAALATVLAILPPGKELIAATLCDPGDYIHWTVEHTKDDGSWYHFVCAQDHDRLLFPPFWLFFWSVTAWVNVAWFAIRDARRHANES